MKTDVNVFLYILQAAIHKCLLIKSVDINGKFKLNATADNISLYHALELSFNNVDKTSILKLILLIY